MSGEIDHRQIKITSLVGYATGKALINLEWGTEQGQLTSDEARAHALRVMEAAEAADQDLFFVTFLNERIGLDMPQCVQVLREFRVSREKRGK